MTSDHARGTAAPTARQHAARLDAPAGLVLVSACPRCGAGVPSASSDFCERCLAHLYPGHCVFCLEAFLPAQAFCRACGLPPEGVTCGACGTFSRFDFCPNPDCGAGLTPRAAAELERLENDPEVLDAFAELDEIALVITSVESDATPPSETTSPSAREPSVAAPSAAVPSAAVPSAAVPTTAVPSTSMPKNSAVVDAPASANPRPSLAALRAAARGAKTAEDKARVRSLAQQVAEDSMRAVSSRPFRTAQEARAAGTALQVALRCRVVTERLETIAWRCHTFGTEHPEPGGMSLCSDPSGGGVPIMRVITDIDDRSTEFTA